MLLATNKDLANVLRKRLQEGNTCFHIERNEWLPDSECLYFDKYKKGCRVSKQIALALRKLLRDHNVMYQKGKVNSIEVMWYSLDNANTSIASILRAGKINTVLWED